MCFLQDATLENLNDESGNQNKFLDRQYILLKNLDKTNDYLRKKILANTSINFFHRF